MADQIHLHKVNESFVRVEAERDLLHEINDRYTFFAQNYRFMPKYRNGIWDGKIRLLDGRTGGLPHGLVADLKLFAKERGYDLTLDSSINPIRPDDEVVQQFLTHLNLPHELRDYQLAAFRSTIYNQRNIVVSPTGSGKSLIIYLLALFSIFILKKRVLLIVPTTSLVEQMTTDFADYSVNNGFSVDDHVHKIYSGHEKMTNKMIVITTWQSIFRLSRVWFEPYGTVICDEAHLAQAKSITRVMDLCVNATHRIGTTGTLNDSLTHKLVLTGLFGPVFKATTTKKLMDNKTLSKTKIHVFRLEYASDECKDFRKEVTTYHEEMSYLVSSKKRNTFICNLALAQNKNTLILFNYVDTHGKPLFELLNGLKSDPDRHTYFISGGADTACREEIRKLMETEVNAILLASVGTFSVGVNIRNLHNIIFANPTKSVIRVLQSIGRGLRKHDDKSLLRVYDLIDDLSDQRAKKNFALKHGIERVKLYVREKFDYVTHTCKV